MIAPKHAMPMPTPIRPNGNPAGVVEKGVGKDERRGVEIVTFE